MLYHLENKTITTSVVTETEHFSMMMWILLSIIHLVRGFKSIGMHKTFKMSYGEPDKGKTWQNIRALQELSRRADSALYPLDTDVPGVTFPSVIEQEICYRVKNI